MCSGNRKPGQHGPDFGHRRPEIRQHDDFGKRRRHEGRRQARRAASSCSIACAILSITLRLAVGLIRPGMPTRSPPATSNSASAKVDDQRALELAVARLFRRERHRGRAVRPQPYRVRGLPFLLADIEMIVARRAPPVDVLRGLAGNEAAVLPETLAGAGAPPAVQAVDHVGGDAARFKHEARQRCGERSAFAIGTSDCYDLPGFDALSSAAINRSASSVAGSRREWCGLRRGRRTSAPCGA